MEPIGKYLTTTKTSKANNQRAYLLGAILEQLPKVDDKGKLVRLTNITRLLKNVPTSDFPWVASELKKVKKPLGWLYWYSTIRKK